MCMLSQLLFKVKIERTTNETSIRKFKKQTFEICCRSLVAIVVLGFLCGCVAVGPEGAKPEPQVPESWNLPERNSSELELNEWWTVFEDRLLNELIDDVRERNLDIVAATARLDSYAAGYGIARSQLMPTLGATSGIARDRETERVRNPLGGPLPDNPAWIYQSGVFMSWELDVWGKTRSEIAAARGEWDASIEDRRYLLIMLQAQAAGEYIRLRTAQTRLAHARSNVELQAETRRIVRDRFDAGLTGELDLHQATMNLEATKSQIPQLQSQIQESMNALCLLTGRLPGELEHMMGATEIPAAGDLPRALPTDLLRQRPDIRAAERRLAAQTARIGIARADFLPMLELDGSFALAATDVSEMHESEAFKYRFGPSFTWPLFTGGARRGQLRAAEAMAEAARAKYEQGVLAAYRESADATSNYLNEIVRLEHLDKAVESAEKSVEVVKSLYLSGLVDFQNVLDTQRQLASYQDQRASARGRASIGLVAIYRALGGGWDLNE